MVIDVKEGHLVVFLAQDEEDGVKHFYQLGEVKPPDCLGYLHDRHENTPVICETTIMPWLSQYLHDTT